MGVWVGGLLPDHIVIHIVFVVIPVCVGRYRWGIPPRIAWDGPRIDYSRIGGGLGGWDDNKAHKRK